MRMLADSDDMCEIQMTSLIDMMFLLIIFFIVSTAFISPEKDQNVKLPEVAKGIAQGDKSEDLIVNVRLGGVLVVSGRIISIDELEKRLVDAARKNPKQVVKVRGDAMAYHKQIVRVYEACAKAKIYTVTIVTQGRE